MRTSLLLTLATILISNDSVIGAQGAGLPDGATPLKVVIESVNGTARFARGGQWQRITPDSTLARGDEIVVDVGATLKLEFQRPDNGAVLSASILRGYSKLTIAEAFQLGEQSATQLDLAQGSMRTGVVRTAVPPSFQVRTPRNVVAVRGTEIAEIESSPDLGDRIRMGRIGVIAVHDRTNRFRSARADQQLNSRIAEDRTGDTLARAIEVATVEYRVTFLGTYRSNVEQEFEISSLVVTEFSSADAAKSEGNPSRDRRVNQQRPSRLINPCPIECPEDDDLFSFSSFGARQRRGASAGPRPAR